MSSSSPRRGLYCKLLPSQNPGRRQSSKIHGLRREESGNYKAKRTGWAKVSSTFSLHKPALSAGAAKRQTLSSVSIPSPRGDWPVGIRYPARSRWPSPEMGSHRRTVVAGGSGFKMGVSHGETVSDSLVGCSDIPKRVHRGISSCLKIKTKKHTKLSQHFVIP